MAKSTDRAICVTYKDSHSIDKNAVLDMCHGATHGIVACNNVRLKAAQPGDLVAIRANQFFLIGELIAPAPEQSHLWKDSGGKAWSYCWSYKPLTHTVEITAAFKERLADLCKPLDLNPQIILNSRLCPFKAKPVLEALSKIYEQKK
jgi:hypothetical protein